MKGSHLNSLVDNHYKTKTILCDYCTVLYNEGNNQEINSIACIFNVLERKLTAKIDKICSTH